jgi:predicted MFS family arabinose efflux permease
VATLVTVYLKTSDPRFVALAFIVQAIGTIVTTTALGGIADRLPRRGLVVGLELARAAMLVAMPFLIGIQWWLMLPVLFGLSCINAIVQPAKQAAIPNLVPVGQVGKANAIVQATVMLASAAGFAIAGGLLSLSPQSTNLLFFADATTFVIAAVIVMGIPSLGGGSISTSVSGALKRSWSVVGARPHLVVSTLAAFLIPMSAPAVVAMAYQISPHGGQTYSMLELVSSVGIVAGSILVGRFGAIGTMRTVGSGLLLSGVFSLAIAVSPVLAIIAGALFIASVGNPIYAVANQTALVEAADSTNRGSVMSTRFGLAQTAGIIGLAIGGLVAQAYGPYAAFGVLGIGLILLAMYAIAAGRPTTNPLHGAEYEEAMLGQAKT